MSSGNMHILIVIKLFFMHYKEASILVEKEVNSTKPLFTVTYKIHRGFKDFLTKWTVMHLLQKLIGLNGIQFLFRHLRRLKMDE